MQEEISNALAEIEIAVKNARRHTKKTAVTTGVIVIPYVVLTAWIGLTYPILLSAWFVFSFFPMLFALLYFVGSLYYYIWPYSSELSAFRKIANVGEILSRQNKSLAYEEAYQCSVEAFRIFRKINLSDLVWYKETTDALARFKDNFELIVLPAIVGHRMKKEHMEQVALAIYSQDISRIKETNALLESSYERGKRPQKEPAFSVKAISKSKAGSFLISLCLSFGLVLALCLIYVFLTQQDFVSFAKDRPDIIILGGLIVSGITFWQTAKR